MDIRWLSYYIPRLPQLFLVLLVLLLVAALTAWPSSRKGAFELLVAVKGEIKFYCLPQHFIQLLDDRPTVELCDAEKHYSRSISLIHIHLCGAKILFDLE